jgi:hypothetical protein
MYILITIECNCTYISRSRPNIDLPPILSLYYDLQNAKDLPDEDSLLFSTTPDPLTDADLIQNFTTGKKKSTLTRVRIPPGYKVFRAT